MCLWELVEARGGHRIPLELEPQVVVSLHVGSGTQTCVLARSSALNC